MKDLARGQSFISSGSTGLALPEPGRLSAYDEAAIEEMIGKHSAWSLFSKGDYALYRRRTIYERTKTIPGFFELNEGAKLLALREEWMPEKHRLALAWDHTTSYIDWLISGVVKWPNAFRVMECSFDMHARMPSSIDGIEWTVEERHEWLVALYDTHGHRDNFKSIYFAELNEYRTNQSSKGSPTDIPPKDAEWEDYFEHVDDYLCTIQVGRWTVDIEIDPASNTLNYVVEEKENT